MMADDSDIVTTLNMSFRLPLENTETLQSNRDIERMKGSKKER